VLELRGGESGRQPVLLDLRDEAPTVTSDPGSAPRSRTTGSNG
jgi:hypothetical protein